MRHQLRRLWPLTLILLAGTSTAAELIPDPRHDCEYCEAWSRTGEPFRVFGNTWFVGGALSSILITSDKGHVLIDGGLTQSAPQIAANIAKLGFRLEDVKYILNSHTHYDHAGGIAALQRASGAGSRRARRANARSSVAARWKTIRSSASVPSTTTFPRWPMSAPQGRRNTACRRHCNHRALHPRSHAGRHFLDLEILRPRRVPGHGVRRQPELDLGAGLQIRGCQPRDGF
jgi:phosphoribosyl 1,2-cyclic phosphodiesterase